MSPINVKSLILMVNNYCNSMCSMCNLWKSSHREDLNILDVRRLFSINEISQVEEVNVTGGEPMMKSDIDEIIGAIIECAPRLKRVILSTNGTKPQLTKDIVSKYAAIIPELLLHVSIEGTPEIHRKIRGIDSYPSSVETLRRCGLEKRLGYRQAISTTLQGDNCSYENLLYLQNLAKETGSAFTFRFAATSNIYYDNFDMQRNFLIADDLMEQTMKFIKEKGSENRFWSILKNYYFTGKIPLMQDDIGNSRCKAGKLFLFVKSDGKIYPCMFSNRTVGNLREGIVQSLENTLKHAPCPCCSEAHIYPMLKKL